MSSLLLVLMTTPGAFAGAADPPVFRSSGGQFTFLEPVRAAPDISIRTLDGTDTSLRQFRGKVVLLNFWATWCGPCVYEMPSLDRLAAREDSWLAILAVSIDRDGAASVAPFARKHHLTHLAISLDPDQRLGSLTSGHVGAGALPLLALPTSYIIDTQGRVIGFVPGAAEWDSLEALRFLDYFAKEAPP